MTTVYINLYVTLKRREDVLFLYRLDYLRYDRYRSAVVVYYTVCCIPGKSISPAVSISFCDFFPHCCYYGPSYRRVFRFAFVFT